MKNVQHNPLNGSELFRSLCRYFMLTNKLLAYHDRSDGGLLVTLAEMAFAGSK